MADRGRHLPWEDLAEHLAWLTAERLENPPSMTDLAAAAGVTSRTCHRWANEGVPLHTADIIADRLRDHPVSIWGQTYYAVANG